MNIDDLVGPARRFLSERLLRLRESLEQLGLRLREGIAKLVGSHVGDAARAATAAALRQGDAARDRDPYRDNFREAYRENRYATAEEDDDFGLGREDRPGDYAWHDTGQRSWERQPQKQTSRPASL